MAKKTYVIDTSVFLSDANCLYRFKNNDIVIPLKVLEEIDKHKKRQDSVGFNARLIIKHLDALRAKGSLHKGLCIDKGLGILRVAKASKELPEDLISMYPIIRSSLLPFMRARRTKREKLLSCQEILICE